MKKTYRTEAEYYADHRACPRCGSGKYGTTYLGFVFRPGQPYRDENQVECECGWKGIFDELVPLAKGSARSGGILAMDRMPSKEKRAAARERARGNPKTEIRGTELRATGKSEKKRGTENPPSPLG
jgi:hypothetical protein